MQPECSANNHNLDTHGLEAAMRCLISVALDGSVVTYGELARHIEVAAGFSKIFTPRIGRVAGSLMRKIHSIDPSAPLINVLVVNQRDGQPSGGAGSFMASKFNNPSLRDDDYKQRYPTRWKRYFQKAADEAYAFSAHDWSQLYGRVFGKKLTESEIERERAERSEGQEHDYGAGEQKYGRGGESEHHKALRLWVEANPQAIQSSFVVADAETEFPLYSGDRVDVVYRLPDRTVLLEVKSRISNDNDHLRGVYQCIKYRAVKAAMDVREDPLIDVYLVTETEPSGRVRSLLRLHDIKHFQAPVKRK